MVFRVDGIIIDPCHNRGNDGEYRRIQAAGTPLVFFDRIPENEEVSKVTVDDYIQSFFGWNIRYGQDGSGITNAGNRKRGYREALEKFRIPYEPVLVVKAGIFIMFRKIIMKQRI